jgi:hypothetical protein
LRVETKRAEDGRARHLDIKAVLVINKRKVFDFVNNEALECVVED